ncbi:MAG: hypothetical protein ACRDJW_09205 [Thermomicrobiales bacterium]
MQERELKRMLALEGNESLGKPHRMGLFRTGVALEDYGFRDAGDGLLER